MWKGRIIKAVVPGGLSTGVMTAEELDTLLDFSAPMKVDCLGLGTGCAIVMDETYSMVDFLHNSCRFFAHESCGQCTPCREGTHWAMQMLDRIKAGRGQAFGFGPAIGNRRFDRHYSRHNDLRPGRRAAWPMKNTIRKFRGELEDYIKRTNPDWLHGDRAGGCIACLREDIICRHGENEGVESGRRIYAIT